MPGKKLTIILACPALNFGPHISVGLLALLKGPPCLTHQFTISNDTLHRLPCPQNSTCLPRSSVSVTNLLFISLRKQKEPEEKSRSSHSKSTNQPVAMLCNQLLCLPSSCKAWTSQQPYLRSTPPIVHWDPDLLGSIRGTCGLNSYNYTSISPAISMFPSLLHSVIHIVLRSMWTYYNSSH